MDTVPHKLVTPLTQHLLSIADDKFILGHRNADWTGLAPILEEDIAFSSMAQDELSHATALYGFIAELTDGDPNQIAFGRGPSEYRNAQLVELSDEFDWAAAIVRKFYCNHFDLLRLTQLSAAHYAPLGALAARMLAELRTHIPHADGWLVRLARGTDESRQRVQAALERLAPQAVALFEPTSGFDKLLEGGLLAEAIPPRIEAWSESLHNVAGEGGLRLSLPKYDPTQRGGRSGLHTTEFAAMLDELAEVYRVEPQASW